MIDLQHIDLTVIRLDGGTQPRAELNEKIVDEFAENEYATQQTLTTLARHCGVSVGFVHKKAREMGISFHDEKIVTRGDSTYSMHTANIGTRSSPRNPPDLADEVLDPPADLNPPPRDTHFDEPLDEYEQALVDAQQVTAATAPAAAQVAVHPTSPSAMSQAMQVLTSQESNEWYTPAWVIGLVREVMGNIDLDPASSEAANQTVQARRFFAEDGINQDWTASTLFLNPPYSGDAATWSRKLVQAYTTGRVQEACLLVFAKLGYDWFEDLWHAYPTCCFRKRISFVRPDGSDDGQAKHGSAMLYLGTNVSRFHRVFEPYGKVVFPFTPSTATNKNQGGST